MASNIEEAKIQRRYYADTASKYNDMHFHENDEHYFALTWMLAAIDVSDHRGSNS